jgi:methylglyoxal synthase
MTTNNRIAFIAHNNKKVEMTAFLYEHKETIKNACDLCVATATTGKELERMGFNVKSYVSGPDGGDAQIASRIVENKIKMVIFFIDPMHAHPHDADIKMLQRVCLKKNIPLALNKATAELLIKNAKDL